jgi:CheY-like chemotaxis protein
VKFTDHGYVALRIQVEPPGRLSFLVQDTGIGISADQLSNIFKPFGQGDPSTIRRFGGTGLGLVLSQRLAQAMGGNVELVDSRVDFGSTFRISLEAGPFTTSPKVLRFEKRSGAAPNGERQISTSSIGGCRVLVVEDNPDVRFLVRHLLRSLGANVDSADDGYDGVAKILANDYDGVLMDIQMPKMDGYEAVRRLREANFLKPIVALTAHAMKGERDSCLKAGFSGYIPKPVERETLIRVLSDLLRPRAPVHQLRH